MWVCIGYIDSCLWVCIYIYICMYIYIYMKTPGLEDCVFENAQNEREIMYIFVYVFFNSMVESSHPKR